MITLKRLACALMLCLLTGMSPAAQALQPGEAVHQLHDNWAQYRHRFIQQDGRVIDYHAAISTSEGQSYAMLRAVWLRDKEWFDKSYQWAEDNLQRKEDHLFAWKWGQRPDGSWGAQDKTSATDADQDIALALILAHEIWKEPRYQKAALEILDDIWDKQTIQTPIGRVILPGDWKMDHREVQINPSYFAPYAYRVFAEADPRHPWKQLIKSSYQILASAMAQTKTGLPPDWVAFSTADGSVRLYTDPQDPRSDYGYEAIRVFWKAGMDSLLDPTEQRAVAVLKSGREAHAYLPRYWRLKSDLPGPLTWDGIARKDTPDSAAVYGAPLSGIAAQDAEVAREIVDRLVVPNLKPGARWNTPDDYYTQNWLWFGLATYQAAQTPMAYPKKLSWTERLTWLMNLDATASAR